MPSKFPYRVGPLQKPYSSNILVISAVCESAAVLSGAFRPRSISDFEVADEYTFPFRSWLPSPRHQPSDGNLCLASFEERRPRACARMGALSGANMPRGALAWRPACRVIPTHAGPDGNGFSCLMGLVCHRVGCWHTYNWRITDVGCSHQRFLSRPLPFWAHGASRSCPGFGA
jgi:hypothetical protein